MNDEIDAFGNAIGNSIVSGLSKRPESTTQGVSDKTKQQIEQAKSTGQQISPALAEQYVREVAASKNGAVNLTVQRDGSQLIVGGDGFQNANVDLSQLTDYSSLTTARTGLAGHFGDAWTGSSAGRGLNMMFMNAQKGAIDKTLSTPLSQSAAYIAGESRGYNNATYQARDRIAFNQRFAQNSSNIASANQSMYDREQARVKMSTLDKVQMGLDVAGMSEFPLVSQIADLGSAGISAYKGDWVGVGLSAGAAIPIIGKAFEGTRLARTAERLGETVASRGAELRQKYGHLNPDQRLARIQELSVGNNVLRESGVPSQYISEALQSFEPGTIATRIAGENDFGARLYGGVAGPKSPYLGPTLPLGNARELSATVPGNSLKNIAQWQIKPGTQILEGRIRAAFGQPGGGRQIYVPDFFNNLLKPGG